MAKKRKYSPETYAGTGAVCFVVVLFGVLMPWYSVTTPFATQNWNGTQLDFLGLWAVILAGLGLVAGGAFALSLVKDAAAKAALGVAALAYLIAWTLTMVDMFREMPSYVTANLVGTKGFGVYSASFGALFGAACCIQALLMLNKRVEGSEEGEATDA